VRLELVLSIFEVVQALGLEQVPPEFGVKGLGFSI
jgi:type III secretory pathway component EscR